MDMLLRLFLGVTRGKVQLWLESISRAEPSISWLS
jgi:hypothetical protein